MIWSSKSVLPSQNFDADLFHVEKQQMFMILMIFIIFWFFGPKVHGIHGTLPFFEIFRKLNLWSGTYLEVFLGCLGPQGTP